MWGEEILDVPIQGTRGEHSTFIMKKVETPCKLLNMSAQRWPLPSQQTNHRCSTEMWVFFTAVVISPGLPSQNVLSNGHKASCTSHCINWLLGKRISSISSAASQMHSFTLLWLHWEQSTRPTFWLGYGCTNCSSGSCIYTVSLGKGKWYQLKIQISSK